MAQSSVFLKQTNAGKLLASGSVQYWKHYKIRLAHRLAALISVHNSPLAISTRIYSHFSNPIGEGRSIILEFSLVILIIFCVPPPYFVSCIQLWRHLLSLICTYERLQYVLICVYFQGYTIPLFRRPTDFPWGHAIAYLLEALCHKLEGCR
jgi:hypothetical protein